MCFPLVVEMAGVFAGMLNFKDAQSEVSVPVPVVDMNYVIHANARYVCKLVKTSDQSRMIQVLDLKPIMRLVLDKEA